MKIYMYVKFLPGSILYCLITSEEFGLVFWDFGNVGLL